MNKFFLSVLLLGAAVLVVPACKDGEDTTPASNNILDVLKADANLSTLVSALERASLDQVFTGTDEYTLFAPSNAAFTQLLTDLGANSLNDIPVDVLTNVLLNHVVSGEKKAASLSTGYVNNLLPYGAASGVTQSLFVNTASGVKVNDATVTAADADASNGVVHTINKVMLPATVVNQALNNPEFSTLVAALTRSDLGVDYVGLLSGTGPFTVFAPTNAAFAALLTELGVPDLNAIPAATLNSVLQYHVVGNANVRAENLTNGQVSTFGGSTFTVGLTGGAKITDAKARVSNIIITNVQADNGVVHAIDKVLLP